MEKGFFRRLRRRVKNRLFQHKDRVHADETPPESTDQTQPPAACATSPYGILVWHDCPYATVDICFVHGLTGDRDRTWTANSQKQPWPRTMLPPELPNARILTYGYDAYFMSEGVSSGNRLSDHARNLITELTTNRSRDAQNRPIIFVVHSLGGLIIKKGLLLSQDNRDDHLKSIFKCTKGIPCLLSHPSLPIPTSLLHPSPSRTSFIPPPLFLPPLTFSFSICLSCLRFSLLLLRPSSEESYHQRLGYVAKR